MPLPDKRLTMNNEQYYTENPALDNETDNFNSLKYFLSRCLYHWPLFLLGVIVTMGITYYKLRSEKPSYETASKILVNNGKSAGESSALEKLNVTETTKG